MPGLFLIVLFLYIYYTKRNITRRHFCWVDTKRVTWKRGLTAFGGYLAALMEATVTVVPLVVPVTMALAPANLSMAVLSPLRV